MNGLMTKLKKAGYRLLILAGLALLALISLATDAIAQQTSVPGSFTTDDAAVRKVMAVQDRYTDVLMSFENVNGTGTALSESGELTIVIFTIDDRDMPLLPTELEGIPVERKVIGEIKPAVAESEPSFGKGTSQTAVNTTAIRPAPIGTSAGNENDCGGGTIGVRVKRGTSRFVLSCNHVFSRTNGASLNEAIMQPDRSVIGCAYNIADTIGRLVDYQPLVVGTTGSNAMDAAMVSTTTSLVSASTPPGGYGSPSATTILAALNMRVLKYGKTTGQTKGKVATLNVTIGINYWIGLVRFTGQVMIDGSGFVDVGDSGSLVVTDNSSNYPVGLVFARSGSSYTFINPINPILSRFNVEIDDGTPTLLPVELSSFSGLKKGDDVQLKWRTETELHNYGFIVQRSSDKQDWDDADFVAGAGESYSPREYSYIDYDISRRHFGTTLYYRLLQLDRDGTENYSSVLEISQRPSAPAITVYPHPVRNEATLQLQLSEAAVGSLTMYDSYGRRIEDQCRTVDLREGSHVLPISASSLNSGSYFIEFATSEGVIRKHILVAR